MKTSVPKQVSPSSKLKELAQVRALAHPQSSRHTDQPAVAPAYTRSGDVAHVQVPECRKAWRAFADNLKQKPPTDSAAVKDYKKQRKKVSPPTLTCPFLAPVLLRHQQFKIDRALWL